MISSSNSRSGSLYYLFYNSNIYINFSLKKKAIKTRQINTLFKNKISLIYRIQINIQQFSFGFFGKSDIVSFASWPTFYLENTYGSYEALIYILYLYLNLTKKLWFPTTSWKNITTYLIILLLIIYLVFSSISPTFAVTTEPTSIFFLMLFSYFTSFSVMTTLKIMFECVWGGRDYWFQ